MYNQVARETAMFRIGRYEIQDHDALGCGGFAKVYRAYDPVMKRYVAVKVLNSTSDLETSARFRREAEITASLQHPNIISVHDYGEYEGQPYLVMELLEGKNLKDVIASPRDLPLLKKANIMAQIADGLDYAHRKGVVHRDIKPANIILLETGDVKILDFGIAVFMDQSRTRYTESGCAVGTAEYMAPEQIEHGTADALTDIFSFGVMCYELLTGKNPFRSNLRETIFHRIFTLEPEPLCRLVANCPKALQKIVQKAYEKRPLQRHPSMESCCNDLAVVAVTLRNGEAERFVGEAKRLMDLDNFEGARSCLHNVFELDPTHDQGLELIAEIQRKHDHHSSLRRAQELIRLGEDQMAQAPFEALKTFGAAYRALPASTTTKLRGGLKRRCVAAKKCIDAAQKASSRRRVDQEGLYEGWRPRFQENISNLGRTARQCAKLFLASASERWTLQPVQSALGLLFVFVVFLTTFAMVWREPVVDLDEATYLKPPASGPLQAPKLVAMEPTIKTDFGSTALYGSVASSSQTGGTSIASGSHNKRRGAELVPPVFTWLEPNGISPNRITSVVTSDVRSNKLIRRVLVTSSLLTGRQEQSKTGTVVTAGLSRGKPAGWGRL